MVVVSINHGVGYASSGVEYAQAYRSRIMKSLRRKQVNIFLDFMPDDIIYDMLDNLGIESASGVWLYDYFRDIRVETSSKTLDGFLSSSRFSKSKELDKFKVKVYSSDEEGTYDVLYLSHFNEGVVLSVEHIVKGYLLHKEYYSGDKVYCKEYFTPVDGIAYRYRREFFNNNDSSIYLEEFIDNTKNSRFYLNGIFYKDKQSLFKYMMSQILGKSDFVLIDRADNTARALFDLKKSIKFRLGVVVHAEHYVTKPYGYIWNNYYDYVFRNSYLVDTFICSTGNQKSFLYKQLLEKYGIPPRIDVIPVGYIEEIKKPETGRNLSKLITVSRLASEKNIDVIIKSLGSIRSKYPNLNFQLDIYGEGAERSNLESLISEYNLDDSVFLKGHVDVSNLYSKYGAYVTASQSEGFGLSLLEAIGSGCVLLGYNVPYGNTEFCREGFNGLLCPYSSSDEDVTNLENIIVKYLSDPKIFVGNSYSVAEGYFKESVALLWRDLLSEKFV